MNGVMNVALTNLGKYNQGVLDYVWLSLPATSEAIAEAMDAIQVSHDGIHYLSDGIGGIAKNDIYGEYEEYFITDYECEFYKVGEYENIDSLNELAEEIENLADYEQDIVKALINEGYSLEEAIEKKDDCILWDDCDSMTDVAYRYIEECDMFNGAPEWITNYFDYEAFGRDLSYDGQWIATENGFIEVR